MTSARTALPVLLASLAACSPLSHVDPRDGGVPDAPSIDGGTPLDGGAGPTRELRFADRALVEWLASDAGEPWWIEERLAPQPTAEGDRELGPRAIVRAAPGRTVVWMPPASDRLTDACRHPSGQWSAVGVDDDRRIFLARGDAAGLLDRIVLDDPALAGDAGAWLGTPRDVPRVGALSEASPAIACDGEDVVVSVVTEDVAVLVYRWLRRGAAFVRGPRTLVSPAVYALPYLPIGGSYDDFDAMFSPYHARLATDEAGRAFVAIATDRSRLARHNALLGTDLDLLRDRLYPRENTWDALVSRVERDGRIGFARVVGTVDVEDEVFAIAVGESRVAVLGRSRRELGRDNTELHAMISELDLDGTPLGTTTFDALANGIAQAGAYVGTSLFVGGTEGWLQNPSGRSVYQEGQPFLVRLHDGAAGRTIERLDGALPSTEGHAELRAVRVEGELLFLGGHERGPLTHTGDSDPTLIRSDAYLRIAPLP